MQSFLTDNDRTYLQMLHRKQKNRSDADRIKAILFLDSGDTYAEVAKRLMLDETTIRNYYKLYETGGIVSLLKNNYTGKRCYLNEEQLQFLDQHIQSHLYTDSKEIAHYIAKTYGVLYSHDAVKKLLHRLGFVYKKPKHVPSKADAKQQQEWLLQYEALKRQKQPGDKILFMDGCHPMHNSQPAYGWIKQGDVKPLKSNTGRQRININGAYDIEEHELTMREDDSINAQSTIALFEQLLEKYPLVTLYIILDNARYYRSKLVKAFLKEHWRIQLKYLPPYSPNLNLIERLWKFYKSQITYNKYYEKFAVFKEKTIDFFENLENYREELETLMTDNFQTLPVPIENSS